MLYSFWYKPVVKSLVVFLFQIYLAYMFGRMTMLTTGSEYSTLLRIFYT